MLFIGSHPVPQPRTDLGTQLLHHGRSVLSQPIVDRLITDRDGRQRANPKATDAPPQIPLRNPAMQQTPQDACCQQLIAQAGWPSALLPDGGFARFLDRLHQQGFHQRGWGLDHWQIPLSRGIIRHREVSFFSFKDSFEKDCPLFFPFWQPLSGISWSRCPWVALLAVAPLGYLTRASFQHFIV